MFKKIGEIIYPLFAKDLSKDLYCLSFPNKTAKYLGLEIADLISYGYYLSFHHRRSKNILYYTHCQLIA